MPSFPAILALACCFLSADVSADQAPAKGMFLVATEEVDGPYFAKTVILLLHHDRTGSFGLVVNRPIDVSAMESLECGDRRVAVGYRSRHIDAAILCRLRRLDGGAAAI